MNVCLVEDKGYKHLFPITKTRPVFGIRCGRFTNEERIIKILNSRIDRIHYIMRPELEQVWKNRNCAEISFDFDIPDKRNCLFLNGRVLFAEESLREIIKKTDQKKPFIWLDGDMWIAFYLPDIKPEFSHDELINGDIDLSYIKDQTYRDQAIIHYPWDIIRYNSGLICKDFSFIKKSLTKLSFPPLPGKVAVLNSRNLIIGKYSELQPFVTFDCTEGPVIIGDNVRIEAGAYLKGPLSIGDHCLISANSKLYSNTTIGNTCKVGGEISNTIIHGFTNKRHNGFLGNSYLGEWINIGAGSNISNMKNNYNTVTMHLNGKSIDTNTQFIGLFMGDHSRSAIGTMFNTATIVGVGCNVFGDGLTPGLIEDFSWGGINDDTEIYDFQKFINNVYRMFIRREMELKHAELELLYRIYKSRIKSNSMGKNLVISEQ